MKNYVYETSLYDLDFDKFKSLFDNYKTIYLDELTEGRVFLRGRFQDLKQVFDKWLSNKKEKLANYFYYDVKFVLEEYKDNVHACVIHKTLPPKEKTLYFGCVSKLDREIVYRLIDKYGSHTFPSLDGMCRHIIHKHQYSVIDEYLDNLLRIFGNVTVVIKEIWCERGYYWDFIIPDDTYTEKLNQFSRNIQSCIDHDRAVGLKYND